MSEEIKFLDNSDTKTSKELLYSEYVGVSATEQAIKLLENKKKEKPCMIFKRSSVLQRVNELLPLLEQSQNEMYKKPLIETNVEALEEGASYVEMDVALVKPSFDETDDCNNEAREDTESSGSESSFSNVYNSDHDEDFSVFNEAEHELEVSSSVESNKSFNYHHDQALISKNIGKKLVTVIDDEDSSVSNELPLAKNDT